MDNYNENLQKNIYFHYVNTKTNADLNVIAFGHEKCAKNKEPIGPIQKNNFMIHFILNGKGYYFINNRKYLLTKGDIFFTPPQLTYHYVQDYEEPWEYIWFEFSGLNALTMCSAALLTSENPTYSTVGAEIKDELIKLLNHPRNSIALEYYSLAYLYYFFSKIINERCSETEKVLTNKSLQVKSAIKYIEENFSNPNLSLKMISEQLYINPSYLSRIFKEETGSNLINHIISLRIQKASDYLENTSFSIKDIAYKVGYTNPHFFSREFKKYRGLSPSKYTSEGSFKE